MKKAILVGLSTKNDDYSLDYSLEELKNLVKECDIEVINIVKQKGRLNPKTYIGSGKIEELLVEIKLDSPDYVICNDELSPLMLKNLNDILPCEVRDRSLVILDIFSKHAKTTEANLEIKLAHLKYLLPRLQSLREGFDRQGGLGSKGPGETQLELDRRKVYNDILKIEKQLEEIHKMKASQIEHRKKNNLKTVSLVGYTNAGKSSTMNTLIKYLDEHNPKTVKAEDKLFATLTTSVRKLEHKNVEFLLTDTVGFVSKLPTHLVHSFNQTLAEVKDADLIIHVLDISNKYAKEQYDITNQVLLSLGVDLDKVLVLFNKIDLCDSIPKEIDGPFLNFSNKTMYNVAKTLDYIVNYLTSDYVNLSLIIPYSDSKIMNFIIENTKVLSKLYQNDGIYLEIEAPNRYVDRLKKYEVNSSIN